MRSLLLLPAAAFGLAACAQNPPPSPIATAPAAMAPSATTSTFSAQPPDQQSGSQQYQSPDLPKRYRPVGGL